MKNLGTHGLSSWMRQATAPKRPLMRFESRLVGLRVWYCEPSDGRWGCEGGVQGCKSRVASLFGCHRPIGEPTFALGFFPVEQRADLSFADVAKTQVL